MPYGRPFFIHYCQLQVIKLVLLVCWHPPTTTPTEMWIFLSDANTVLMIYESKRVSQRELLILYIFINHSYGFLQVVNSLVQVGYWSIKKWKLDRSRGSSQMELKFWSNGNIFFNPPQIRILCFHWLKGITFRLHTYQAFLYSKVQYIPQNFEILNLLLL